MNLPSNLLISAEKDVRSSSVYLAYLLLKKLDLDRKITVFDLYSEIKKQGTKYNYTNVLYALIFLYIVGLIDFDEPYVVLTNKS